MVSSLSACATLVLITGTCRGAGDGVLVRGSVKCSGEAAALGGLGDCRGAAGAAAAVGAANGLGLITLGHSRLCTCSAFLTIEVAMGGMSAKLENRRPIWTVAEDAMDESRLCRPILIGGGFRSSKLLNAVLLFSTGEYVVGGRIVIDAVLAMLFPGNKEYEAEGLLRCNAVLPVATRSSAGSGALGIEVVGKVWLDARGFGA